MIDSIIFVPKKLENLIQDYLQVFLLVVKKNFKFL